MRPLPASVLAAVRLCLTIVGHLRRTRFLHRLLHHGSSFPSLWALSGRSLFIFLASVLVVFRQHVSRFISHWCLTSPFYHRLHFRVSIFFFLRHRCWLGFLFPFSVVFCTMHSCTHTLSLLAHTHKYHCHCCTLARHHFINIVVTCTFLPFLVHCCCISFHNFLLHIIIVLHSSMTSNQHHHFLHIVTPSHSSTLSHIL